MTRPGQMWTQRLLSKMWTQLLSQSNFEGYLIVGKTPWRIHFKQFKFGAPWRANRADNFQLLTILLIDYKL